MSIYELITLVNCWWLIVWRVENMPVGLSRSIRWIDDRQRGEATGWLFIDSLQSTIYRATEEAVDAYASNWFMHINSKESIDSHLASPENKYDKNQFPEYSYFGGTKLNRNNAAMTVGTTYLRILRINQSKKKIVADRQSADIGVHMCTCTPQKPFRNVRFCGCCCCFPQFVPSSIHQSWQNAKTTTHQSLACDDDAHENA